MSPIDDVFAEPETKRQKTAHVRDDIDLLLDVQTDVMDTFQDRRVFFDVIQLNPADKKVFKPSIGAGGRVGANYIAIAVHQSMPACAANSLDAPVIASGGSKFHRSDVYYLEGLAGDDHDIERDMLAWQGRTLQWTIRSQAVSAFD